MPSIVPHDAAACDRLQARRQRKHDAALPGQLDNRQRQRMRTRLFEARGQSQHLGLIRGQTDQIRHCGRPTVRVPVLSTTSTLTCSARSSASAFLTRMPAAAPRPVPTMIAVGTASPSAQGQAITSTATALTSAVSKPPRHHQKQKRRQRDRADRRHEDRRNAVGQPLHRRLRALRLRDHADDAGQQGRLADAAGATAQQARAVDRRREHPVAGPLVDRHALAGQHGLVGARLAVDHHAVDRHRVTGAHQEDVSGLQLRHRHLDYLPVALDSSGLRLQLDQRFDRLASARLGPSFEQLAQQHQRDDGGRGLEIHMQVVASGQA